MPRRGIGPHLWWQKPRKRKNGIEQGVWCIKDGNRKRSTSFGAGETEEAQDALAEYITSKGSAPRARDRDPATVPIADVISIYSDDVVENHARKKETSARLDRILDFFGAHMLDYLNAGTCREYVESRGLPAAARRELEDLRAAVNHHWRQGLCRSPTPVVLPERGANRERWLRRKEAARLLRAAWRLRQLQYGKVTDRYTARHVARFILVGLYTGTRAGAICGAAMEPTEGKGWIDLEHGVFYRRPSGKRETKKRQGAIRIPPRLLAHMRRWHRLGIARKAIVEWNGKPIKTKINKAFRSVRKAAELGPDVVPHVLRHTAITWQAQLGVPIHEICGFFKITHEMFDRVYGHHHPDHQSQAVNAHSRARKPAKVESNVKAIG